MAYKDMTDDQKKLEIEKAVEVLENLEGIEPQVLFRACQQVFAGVTVEVLKLSAMNGINNGSRKRFQDLKVQQMLLQVIGGMLLQSGTAQLEQQDFDTLTRISRLMNGNDGN